MVFSFVGLLFQKLKKAVGIHSPGLQFFWSAQQLLSSRLFMPVMSMLPAIHSDFSGYVHENFFLFISPRRLSPSRFPTHGSGRPRNEPIPAGDRAASERWQRDASGSRPRSGSPAGDRNRTDWSAAPPR